MDGFTFGLVFSSRDSFFFNHTQLSPCDRRLSLSGNSGQLAVFRPKVDEISLLSINSTTFDPVSSASICLMWFLHLVFVIEQFWGYMVAFAGRQYAARSLPVFVADSSHTITSFTLVLDSRKAPSKTYSGRSLGVALAQKALLCALTTLIVLSQIPNAKTKEGLWLVTWAYNWLSLVQTKMTMCSTHGTRWRILGNTPSMPFTPIYVILLPVHFKACSELIDFKHHIVY
ncbi:hypothetical protein DH2020_034359 [Rehmannia glutinosa]|uniref:Uncharacterized protein n=1 Tax=Rehmannia glutinosa TaxID=99300 RepID=A0ABR0VA28_REHGL